MTTKTIREIALAWKMDKQRYVKQSSYAAYALILENHILPTFGECETLSEKLVQDNREPHHRTHLHRRGRAQAYRIGY